jgi:LPS export ABC transporter protein LptC
MQEVRRRKVSGLGLRIAAPKLGRVLALLLLAAGVAAVAVSYWRLKDRTSFRLRPGQAQLSTEVVGVIDNLERREMKGERLWIHLKADRDTVYSDGHHQLENVRLEVYPDQGDRPDKISARQTLTNEDNTQFLFTGDVQIETRDNLKVKSESVEYEVKTEAANITTPVSFERENIAGRSDSAHLDAKAKKLDLKGAVEITVSPEAAAAQPDGAQPAAIPKVNLRQPLTLKSAQAVFDQASMQIAFGGGATAEQGRDVMSGETLTGHLDEQKRVKFIRAHTNAYLRTMNEGKAAEVFAEQLDFHFN